MFLGLSTCRFKYCDTQMPDVLSKRIRARREKAGSSGNLYLSERRHVSRLPQLEGSPFESPVVAGVDEVVGFIWDFAESSSLSSALSNVLSTNYL